MKIELQNAGKRFNREWIFRHANLSLSAGTTYAITGPNGSGKSTLLQAIGGMLQLSEGGIHYAVGNGQSASGESRRLAPEDAYRQISFSAPYLEVIEEMTLLEFLEFHRGFKPLLPSVSVASVVQELGLEGAAHKQIRYYSSGMKQRVKLAQALFSATGAVLLDEPCSNLDAAGIELYHRLVATYGQNRLLVVCSNDKVEYSFCDEVISVQQFKPTR